MLRNFLINIFFLVPVWFLNLIGIFNKDIKRKFIFDIQSKFFLSLIPQFNIHEVSDENIPEVRNLIEQKRRNLPAAWIVWRYFPTCPRELCR